MSQFFWFILGIFASIIASVAANIYTPNIVERISYVRKSASKRSYQNEIRRHDLIKELRDSTHPDLYFLGRYTLIIGLLIVSLLPHILFILIFPDGMFAAPRNDLDWTPFWIAFLQSMHLLFMTITSVIDFLAVYTLAWTVRLSDDVRNFEEYQNRFRVRFSDFIDQNNH